MHGRDMRIDQRLLDLFGVDQPILLAPMANFAGVKMAIEVADRHHMAMVFTGRRHFRH